MQSREPNASSPGKGRKTAYRVPVLLEDALGNGIRLELAEGPLVDNVVVAGVVEKTGGDPGLRDGIVRHFAWLITQLMGEQSPLRRGRKDRCIPLHR